jgi:acetyltransferase-like isoleucine patch superfamily enzyme
MMKDRIMPLLRILRSGKRVYSPVAYLFGALLPGGKSGTGPVAWLRGRPMPDVRRGAGIIELGHVALYPGVHLHCRGSGRIAIGDGSFLNRNVRVFAGQQVVIHRNCMVSWGTVITDFAGFDAGEPFAPVTLEDEVWIGSRVVILGGTRLGRGCVVAAGSVVQGEFPAGTIIAGKPAEVVA